MKVGRRLAIKLLNASKFVLGIGEPEAGTVVTEAIDKAMLAELAQTVQVATDWFEGYDYARALEQAEAFFWNFCDNYLELVKDRAYGEQPAPGTSSARASLRIALSAIIRLFAPILPFVAEEVWSWWQEGSVHRAGWPTAGELGIASGLGEAVAAGDRQVLAVASDVIAAIRKAKSEAKVSMRTEVTSVQVSGPAALLDRVALAEGDLRAAGRTAKIEHLVTEAAGLQVAVSL
jgi:valyl-tRNA synthetase